MLLQAPRLASTQAPLAFPTQLFWFFRLSGSLEQATEDEKICVFALKRDAQAMRQLTAKYVDDILLLLTTQVENVHAVSHFTYETLTVLQHAQDFGTIVKESLRRSAHPDGQQSTTHKTGHTLLSFNLPCTFLL